MDSFKGEIALLVAHFPSPVVSYVRSNFGTLALPQLAARFWCKLETELICAFLGLTGFRSLTKRFYRLRRFRAGIPALI
jgi:hypothetical protein